MTNKSVRNIPASIRQRLLNLARERQNDYGLVLTQYAIERLLARLCLSPYAEQFVLKGAQLFPLWMDVLHRPTRDLDLLRQGESSSGNTLSQISQTCSSATPSSPIPSSQKIFTLTSLNCYFVDIRIS